MGYHSSHIFSGSPKRGPFQAMAANTRPEAAKGHGGSVLFSHCNNNYIYVALTIYDMNHSNIKYFVSLYKFLIIQTVNQAWLNSIKKTETN